MLIALPKNHQNRYMKSSPSYIKCSEACKSPLPNFFCFALLDEYGHKEKQCKGIQGTTYNEQFNNVGLELYIRRGKENEN